MKKVFLISLVLFSLLFSFQGVNAQSGSMNTTGSGTNGTVDNTSPAPVKLTNPLGNDVTSPNVLIGKIINSLLGLVGSLALLMFVYGGLTWMTSSGSQEKVKKGRDIIIWAAIGLIIVFSSYGLIRFLLSSIKS